MPTLSPNEYGKEEAIAGMIVGLIFTLFHIISVKFTGMPAWFFGVSAERIGTLGMFLNLIVTFIVSRIVPHPYLWKFKRWSNCVP